jgi:hypothetical protein
LSKKSFLSKHLNIAIQKPFNQTEFENISRRIQHLNYLNLDKEPTVYFALQKARVELSLSKRKTNSFDGIVGLVPGTSDRNSDINGELNLNLENLFKSGKIFQFHWKKITTQTQQLNVKYEHPHLLGSRLTLDLSYDQLKESTIFSNRQLHLGFKYNLGLDSKLGFFYENKSGNKLEETTSANGDFDLNNYGIEFELDKLNNSDAPRKGYLLTSKANIGLKNIATNSLIGSLANQKNSNQFEFKAGITSYHPLTINSVLNYSLVSGGLIENPRLFLNDLYRVGGLMTIRGFNENFFYATQYALSSLEWQLYFEESSYLFLFYDQAFLRERTFTSNRSAKPAGLGLGMRIKSAAGFFNLVFGLGHTGGGFSFNQSKIHFGYSGNF